MQTTHQIGAHSVTREESGLLFVQYVGDLSGPDITSVYDAFEALANGEKDVLVLNDLRRVRDVSAAARRRAGDDPRAAIFGAVAAFGASFAVRILANVSATAVRVLGVGIKAPVAFFETEDEARAWLADPRRRGNAHGERAA